jgi:hypothetical protein
MSRQDLDAACPGRRTRLRLDLRTAIALVATVGAGLAAWRTLSDLDPITAAARRVRSAGTSERREAVLLLANAPPSRADALYPLLAREAASADPQTRGAALSGMFGSSTSRTDRPLRRPRRSSAIDS